MSGRLSGFQVEDVAAAHLRLNENYRVVQSHARTTNRLQGGTVHTTRKHDLLMGRFDLLCFGPDHCLRVQVTRQRNVSEKLTQATGPTPPYCIDEVWQWAEDNSGFARWWKTGEGWRERDAVRIHHPRKLVAKADTSLDDEDPMDTDTP